MIEKRHQGTRCSRRGGRALAGAACGIAILALVTQGFATPYFILENQVQWSEALLGPPARVTPLEPMAWGDYMVQWGDFLEEGEPYPTNQYIVPELYVWGGGGGGGTDPEDAGLVMKWGPGPDPDTKYASAWKYEYGLDPNLANSTITVTVTAPQFASNGSQVNNVSFGIQDITGAIRSWHWKCGPGAPIPWNTPTQITINTALTGLGATNPPATGYMNNPGFDITQSLSFIVDENATWVGGAVPVPPPGQQLPAMWNYWHNILVTPGLPQKGTDPLKWSQPVVEWQPGLNPPIFLGWDEVSLYQWRPIVADDWRCDTDDPVTDIHWWGSFLGWDSPDPPPMPLAFHLAIWTDVPDDPANPDDFSHPGQMIWEHYCDNFQWNFAGYDHDPRNPNPEQFTEACFQFVQYLPDPSEWFYQQEYGGPGTVFWLSIAAIYNPDQPPQHPWGWKTRPHYFMDDAVRITDTFDPMGMPMWPPHIGYTWAQGNPIEWQGVSWDVAFELTTRKADDPYNDLGDAPDSSNNLGLPMTAYAPGGGPPNTPANYPTAYQGGAAPAGPIHLNPQALAYLGPAVTLENEADVGPDQDPTNNLIPLTDTPNLDGADDGVLFPIAMPHCQTASFQYQVNVVLPNQTLYVNVWCDWNRDGDWDDTMQCPGPVPTPAPEWAVQNQTLTFASPGLYVVTTPQFTSWHPNAQPDPLWMRITLADQPWQPTAGILGDGGSGPSAGYLFGETEDYYFTPDVPHQDELDFGDAPDPTYPTLAASNGARHIIVSQAPWLGDATDTPDADADGQPNANATGDDLDINELIPNDDEDGVVIPALTVGQSATIGVLVGLPGWVDAWVDWNGNGTWEEPAERIWGGPMPSGLNSVTVIPPGPFIGQTFARFRIHTNDGTALLPTGLANDGEVEDHEVMIKEEEPGLDFGDAPDPTYPTLLASNGARHTIVPGVFLGFGVDGEPDGQPDPAALGDDNDIDPANPPPNFPDEDGVVFLGPLVPGATANVQVTASVPGILFAWLDFGGDGSWAQAVDLIAPGVPLGPGPTVLSFIVPPTTQSGLITFARFRFTTAAIGLGPDGPAPDGEVEDYMVQILPCNTPPQDVEPAAGDGDVDLQDFALFQGCFNGPNRPWKGPPPAAQVCACLDDNDDGDVDLQDFSVFQGCFNGPNRPPKPGC